MQKSIAVVVTVRDALAKILTDPQRDLVERAGLFADTVTGPGWFVGAIPRRGFSPVSVNLIVPEGAAIMLIRWTGYYRRRILCQLVAYDVPLFVDATPSVGYTAHDLPVAVVGVKMDKVRAAEDARAAIQAEAETRVSLVCRSQATA